MKRVVDVVGACSCLILLAPVFLAVAVLIKLDDGGPVFFRQTRVGMHGTPFTLLKFRTMAVDAERSGPGLTVSGDPRVTRVGRFLRRTKLDEVPQLVNVLSGRMSLVGPRPELQRYVDLYTADERRVLDYVPGLTDPASIRFRHEERHLAGIEDPEQYYRDVLMRQKLQLNLEYAERATIATDFAVLLETVFALGSGEPRGTD